MSRQRPHRSGAPEAPVAPRWVAGPVALLAMLLLWVGVAIGLRPLLDTLLTHQQARSWTPVPAALAELRLIQGRRSARLELLYLYAFEGQTLSANRLGVGPADWSGGNSMVHAEHERLERARQAGLTVTAWVDPQAPHRAVLVRELPTDSLLLHLPVALGFTLFGAMLAGIAWVVWRGEAAFGGSGPPTDEQVHAWRNAFVWAFALVWCSLAFPVTALMWRAWPDLVSGLFLLIFDAIGLWLLWAAWEDRVRTEGPPTWPWLLGLAVCAWGLVQHLQRAEPSAVPEPPPMAADDLLDGVRSTGR